MTIERRNPLPVGRYWIDIFQSGFSTFETWLSNNATTVFTETTEDYSQDDPPARFYIFRVTAPTTWPDNRGLGLPTVAAANVHSRADTATRPPPEPDVIDQVSDTAKGFFSDAKNVIFLAVGGALFIGVLSALMSKRRGSRTPR